MHKSPAAAVLTLVRTDNRFTHDRMTPSDKEVRRVARYMAILGPALSLGPLEGQSAKVLKYQGDSRESMTKDSDGIQLPQIYWQQNLCQKIKGLEMDIDS